jgi:hypothetical protein
LERRNGATQKETQVKSGRWMFRFHLIVVKREGSAE